MPCMELLTNNLKNTKDILEENSLIVTLEAGDVCLGKNILKIKVLIWV